MPMAELAGAVHFLTHVILEDDFVMVVLAIDNSYVVGALQQFAGGWRPGPAAKHGEAWAQLLGNEAGAELLVSGRVKVVKIKSHLSRAQAAAAGHAVTSWEANRLADVAADAAAARAEHGPGDLRVIRMLDEAAGLVCRRTAGSLSTRGRPW